MKDVLVEEKYNVTYGLIRMYQALMQNEPENMDISSERTVYRVMEEMVLNYHSRRRPNGSAKAGREARRSLKA